MIVSDAGLSGVKVIEPASFQDARGFFMESYNREALAQHGITNVFVQDNHSLSAVPGRCAACITSWFRTAGEAGPGDRGQHLRRRRRYPPRVADVRPLGRLRAVGRQQKAAARPEGFAHGFMTLEADTEVLLKSTRTTRSLTTAALPGTTRRSASPGRWSLPFCPPKTPSIPCSATRSRTLLTRGEDSVKLMITGGAGFIGSNFVHYMRRTHPSVFDPRMWTR